MIADMDHRLPEDGHAEHAAELVGAALPEMRVRQRGREVPNANPSTARHRKGRIRAVLFDLDDTLLDTRNSMEAALAATCDLALDSSSGLTQEGIREAYYAVSEELRWQQEAGCLSFTTERAMDLHRWREIAMRCEVAPAYADTLSAHYYGCRLRNYRLFPDVPERLPQLLNCFQLALMTNGQSDLQRKKIAVVALDRWIPRAYISSEVGARKPDPRFFCHALAELGCEPHVAVMVGDSLPHDIAGAAALGIRTVWVNRQGQEPLADVKPDATVQDLHGLANLLAGWSCAG
jgi:putative hydrolase of the HAD superfamily